MARKTGTTADGTDPNPATGNNLTSITDANGHPTSFEYNARGWVTQTNFPSSLAETYSYNAIGNPDILALSPYTRISRRRSRTCTLDLRPSQSPFRLAEELG